jgi:hypothetical protein
MGRQGGTAMCWLYSYWAVKKSPGHLWDKPPFLPLGRLQMLDGLDAVAQAKIRGRLYLADYLY